MPEGRHSLRTSAWRFLLAGGLNTLVTAAMLGVLAVVIDPRIAYTIVFLLGLVASTWLAGRFVYGVQMARRDVAAYAVMYGCVFALGLVVVSFLERSDAPGWAASSVVLVTAPLTFVGGRLVARSVDRRRASGAAPATSNVGHP